MIFTQHYLECLSHASYLLGDETTGRAVVVDPRRDVDVYVEEAEARGLTIERVIETHVHADFVSGHLELASRTGAVVSYGPGAVVEFPIEPLRDGQLLSLGDVTLEVLATPGHTPESICIVVFEHSGDRVPFGVLTGDTLFVGAVGRPDLLAAAGDDVTIEVLARRLYRSLHDKLLRLPDATRVFPAHGAGSSCGKQLGAETSSTIGVQRRFNPALRPMSEDAFVADVTEGQPVPPGYFRDAARRNRELHPLAAAATRPLLELDAVLAHRASGGALLDPRAPDDFARGHLQGAVNVGLHGRFAERVGSVIAPDDDIVLVGDPTTAGESVMRLERIGYDRVIGQLADPVAARMHRPDVFEASRRVTAEELEDLLSASGGAVQLIDVRNPAETATGLVPGARTIPLAALTESLATIDRRSSVVLYCASGQRSLTAASVLLAHGFEDVADLVGGWEAWERATRPAASAPLVVHRTQPLNRETSLAAHDHAVMTPPSLFFVRTHFPIPATDPAWRLRVGGLVERPLTLDLAALGSMSARTITATIECAGNGRSTIRPRTEGEQWRLGAVSTAEWTGVALADVLHLARISDSARVVVMRGADAGRVDGSNEVIHYERSLSVDDVRGTGALLVHSMNGAPLPVHHGFPLRLVVPGWYGCASVKWLTGIEAISGAFDGYFQSDRYVYEWQRRGAMTRTPVTTQRVRSVIVSPTDGEEIDGGELVVRGFAWSGDAAVDRVDVDVADRGWQVSMLREGGGAHAWRAWELRTEAVGRGPITIRARATDRAGNVQPDESEWNRLGYGANGIHGVRVRLR